MQDGISAFSFSRITTFEQCARRYRYRYLDGVKEAFRGVEAFMGTQVHATIEWLFDERDLGTRHDLAEAVAHYCDGWDRQYADGQPVRVIKVNGDLEGYRRAGADMVARFHRQRFVGDDLETVATEKHFRIELGGRHPFQGFIDRVAREASGLVHVIDYKTGSRTPARFEGKEAEQLEAYALAMFATSGVDEVELVLEFLKSGTRLSRRIDRREAPEIDERLSRRIDAATSSTVFPPNPGALCDWCGYNDICEAYGSRARPQRRAG
jgi:putative RecB family exonuclease